METPIVTDDWPEFTKLLTATFANCAAAPPKWRKHELGERPHGFRIKTALNQIMWV